MSIYPGLFEKIPEITKPRWYLAPSRLLILLAFIIFFSEIIAMGVLYFLQISNYAVVTILDGLIMLSLILPGLYYLQLNPLNNHIEKLNKTEMTLRNSEELLRKILALLPVGVWITDRNGKILHGNPASQEIWAGARYVGMNQYGEYKGWWAETGERIPSEEWAAARAISRGESSINEEIKIEAFDGAQKFILNSAVPILDEENAIQGAVVVNQDITTLKQAQQTLEESETLFRTAMENLPVGVWLTDRNGKIIYGNSAGQSIWEGARYVEKEKLGEYKGWWLSTGKRIETEEWAVARAIDKGETSLNEEIEIESFDGTHKFILNSAIPVRDDRGQILWAFVVNQDITERKARERELERTNELLERFFASIGTLIAYMDREFNFIRVNEAYANSAGYSADFFIGKNHFDLYPNEENQRIFAEVVKTGEAFSVLEKPFEYPEDPERGVTYWDWSLQPVREADRSVQGLVLSLVDVTERKRAENQLEKQNRELLQLSRLEQEQRELAESLVQSTIVLNSSLNLQEVLRTILEQIKRSIPYQAATVSLLEGGMITGAGQLGFEDHPESTIFMGEAYTIHNLPLFRKVCASLETVFVADTSEDPEWLVLSGLEWVRSYLVAPLVVDDEVIGLLNLYSDQPGGFELKDIEQLSAFTNHAALALRNARLFQAESTARSVAETLSIASQAFTKSLELDHVFNILLDHVGKLVPYDLASIALRDAESNLITRATCGQQLDTESRVIVLPGEMDNELPAQPILLTKYEDLFYPDHCNGPESESMLEDKQVQSWLGMPIVASNNIIGMLKICINKPDFFTPSHVQWVEALVGQAAVAIQNAWLFEQLRAGKERLQALSRRLVEGQESERRFISRELHDEASQALTSMMVDMQVLTQNVHSPELVLSKALELERSMKDLLENLRRLAGDLRPAILDHLGLEATLRTAAENIREKHGLKVNIQLTGVKQRMPENIETTIYRIVQEALNNVIRHANASFVDVILSMRENTLVLIIEDNGAGFEPRKRDHTGRLGLFGIQERAEMLGGTLVIDSQTGKGTTLAVEIPYVD